jgi:transcription initiation factor TFIIH subunit 4
VCHLLLLQEEQSTDRIANELEIAILNLFVNIKVRYQNLVVGKLDRRHVKAAMEKGISANQVSFPLPVHLAVNANNQIISYLSSHAHPQMYLSPPPLLHPTITDQLHLWDKERNRLKIDECKSHSPWTCGTISDRVAIMFEFQSKDLFEETMEEAKRYDGLLHSVRRDDVKLLFIDPAIKDAIREFLQDRQREFRT